MTWLANSSDLNLIENVWKLLKDQIQKHKDFPKTVDKLKTSLKEEWENFNSVYWSIAATEGRQLAVELCASAQQKTADAKRMTVQSLGREFGLSAVQGLKCD